MAKVEPAVYSLTKAAQYLGRSQSTVKQWILTGKIFAVVEHRPNGKMRFDIPKEALDAKRFGQTWRPD